MTRDSGEPVERDVAGFDVHSAFAEHGAAIFAFARNAIGDRAAAEDCVQETFVRAWRSRAQYRAERASQRTWLFAIARNVVVDSHRARGRRPVPIEDGHLERAGPPVDVESPTVDRLTVLAGLAQLNAEQRDVVVAVHLDGMTYQQLSDRSGVPVGTLRSRMFYALRALRDRIGEEGDHGSKPGPA